jgi:hypothetical protein
VARPRWRRKVLADCVERAHYAVAELRERGIAVDLEPGAWLVFDPESAESDAEVAVLLDPIWPTWRECITE